MWPHSSREVGSTDPVSALQISTTRWLYKSAEIADEDAMSSINSINQLRKKGSLSPQKQVPNCVGAGALTPESSMTKVIAMIIKTSGGATPAHQVLCTGVHLLPRALAELTCPRVPLANRDHFHDPPLLS